MAKKAAPKGAKNTKSKRKLTGARSSAGRSAASRRKQEGADPRGVAGIVVLCVGLLTLLCQFFPSNGGLLREIKMILRGLGGTMCMLMPLMLCWIGVTLVFFTSGRMKLKTMICGSLIFVFVETLLQLFQVGVIRGQLSVAGYSDTFFQFITVSYRNAVQSGQTGGLIGALLAWPLYKALDIWGAVLVLIFATMLVLMVFTGVSFTGVGMYLSELLDDLRISLSEHREEHEEQRSAREEERLEREKELAAQRGQKRMEREAQRKAQMEQETAQRAAAEAQQQNETRYAPDEEEEIVGATLRHARKRKNREKPEFEVVRPQEKAEGEPPIQTAPPKRAQAPRKRTSIREDMPLYIERDDEFTREPIGERYDPQAARRRGSFTMEEAEHAFLYGMHSEQAGGTYAPIQAQATAEIADLSQREAQTQEGAYVPQYDPQMLYQDAYGDTVDVQPEEEEIDDDAPFWKDHPDAVIETYEPGETAQDEYRQTLEHDDMPTLSQDDEAPADDDEPYRPYQPQLRRVHMQVSEEAVQDDAEMTPLQRSILAAQREAQGNAPRVQNVLAAQEAAVRDQPNAQLRGTRPDGTPLVMPRKETHEAPKILNDEYVYPPMDLLSRSNSTQDPNLNAKIQAGSAKLLSTLESFGVQAKLTHVTHGPAITRYELQPAPGVKVSRIVNLVDDIALNMAAEGVRIEAPIPGKPAVGIEVPNDKIETVSLRDVLESPEMGREKSPTAVALGKSISGAPVIADMAKMPHVLIAGATGSGKSVCINTIINSIIFRASPKEVRLILIDPKVVELSVYNGVPHLLVPVVTDPKKASAALSWAVVEMEHRYKRFETMGVRNIKGYNEAIGPDEEPMSKIIVIIDELADLMMVAPGEVEESICRLAQLARAAGIHLVIATQRPSVNVITGVIKANIPSRIAFAVSSQIDSRTILDSGGAEKLLGRGDMLYALQGAGKPTRVQGCFVSDDEVQRIVDFVRGRHDADYNQDVIEQMDSAAEEEKQAVSETPASDEKVDEMLGKAIELAIDAGQVSISMLQRRLRVGYARAGRLVDEMTLRGIAGEAEGPTKPRTVLISREEWRRMQENQE